MKQRPPASDFQIASLAAFHDRNTFSCGVDALDDYFRRQAGQDMRRDAACCYVLTRKGVPSLPLGFYTLSSTVVRLGGLPEDFRRRLPRYPFLPATLIGRLAVSAACQGLGLGALLLMDALTISFQQSKRIASVAVVVDVKNQQALKFYEQYGFRPLVDYAARPYLPMKTVARMIGRGSGESLITRPTGPEYGAGPW